MCGINGLLYKEPTANIVSDISEMNIRILHRGPDDDGIYIYDDRLAMGMRRLSIIDLEQGHQPMYNDDRSLIVTFNGEIYNFRELKKGLQDKGVIFRTHSDTEVVLRMFEAYGTGSFSQLNGMFAIAIHDEKNKQVIIARDRFGEKPLYFYRNNKQIAWASELKSLKRIISDQKEIEPKALLLFLSLTYIPAPYTIYKDVYKLGAGHYMILKTEDLDISNHKYWDISLEPAESIKSYTEAKKELKTLLFNSVEKRLIADVPIGVFLSGGVDSTIIAAIMNKISGKKISTFSIGSSNKRYDESERARQIAGHVHSDHHEYILDYTEILEQIDSIILNYDEPFADSSCIPTWYLSKKTSEHVKVALTGDGADEVFGGYNKYLIHSYGNIYDKIVPGFIREKAVKPLIKSKIWKNTDTKSAISKIKKLIEAVGNDVITNHFNIISLGFKKEELGYLLTNNSNADIDTVFSQYIPDLPAGDVDKLKIARYLDKNISLEGDMLVKVDRASMLCSLECRAPFLDYRLIEFSYCIPDHFLIKGNNKKRILKDTFEDLLPSRFFKAPKAGFEVPISYWFRNELKTELLKTLSEEACTKHGYFNYDYISNLLNEHLESNIDHSYKLWTIYCFQKWYSSVF